MGYTKTISDNPTMEGLAEIFPDVVFSHAGDEELKMQILTPWWNHENPSSIPRYPLVVFVQGSGWTFPNVWYEVPQLSELARQGYVIALVTHRDAMQGHPYPACIEDVKTAIRFLRKEADTYGIDTGRVGLFGTSSGGNIALLCALYQNNDYFSRISHSTDSALAKLSHAFQDAFTTSENVREYTEFSDKIDYIVSCFPTTDFVEFYDNPNMDQGIKDVFDALSGERMDDERSVLKAMSPYYIVKEARSLSLPPLFLTHGTGDQLIPYEHSAKFYDLLKETDTDVTFVTVEKGPHEGPFWSRELWQLIFDFIREHS